MSVEEKIDFFCKYFQDQIETIDALTIDPDAPHQVDQERHQVRFYKKVLLITHLDTLAGIRYSKEKYPQLNKRNQERFIKFISESGIWPDGQLVSIPFLVEHTSNGKISRGRLNDLISEKIAEKFEEGSFNLPSNSIDVSIEELMDLATTEQEKKVIRVNRHYELLYRYRNYLVHEAREPGRAMEVTPENEPYYHGYIGEDKLYLAYPIGLFRDILIKAIKYIESYLKANSFDPYDFVTETPRW
jgi:hypothetical protein